MNQAHWDFTELRPVAHPGSAVQTRLSSPASPAREATLSLFECEAVSVPSTETGLEEDKQSTSVLCSDNKRSFTLPYCFINQIDYTNCTVWKNSDYCRWLVVAELIICREVNIHTWYLALVTHRSQNVWWMMLWLWVHPHWAARPSERHLKVKRPHSVQCPAGSTS